MRRIRTQFLVSFLAYSWFAVSLNSCGWIPPIGDSYHPPKGMPVKGWQIKQFETSTAVAEKSPHESQEREKPEAEPDWEESEKQLAGWWHNLGGEPLKKLIEKALANNRDLEQAFVRVRRFQELLGVERSTYFPQIDGTASIDRRKPSGNGFQGQVISGPFSQYDLGTTVNWEIDLFGATTRRINSAIRRLEATEAAAYGVQLALIADVAQSYFDLNSLRRRKVVANEQIKIELQTLDLVESKFKAGLTSELDLLRAKAQVAQIKASAAQLEVPLASAERRLMVLLGVDQNRLRKLVGDSDNWRGLSFVRRNLPIGEPVDLLRRRPDLVEAERQLAAAFEEEGAALADFFPRLSLTGGLGLQSFDRFDLLKSASQSWNIAPALNLPIFSGFRLTSNLRAAKAELREAFLQYQQTVIEGVAEVEESLAQIKGLREQHRQLNVALEAQRESLELSRELYRQGVVDFFDVLDVHLSLFESEDSVVRIEAEIINKIVGLYKSLGGGWSRRQNNVDNQELTIDL